MFGLPYFDFQRHVDTWASDIYAAEAKAWHEKADNCAHYSPRMAARIRDVAKALQVLNQYARDVQRGRK